MKKILILALLLSAPLISFAENPIKSELKARKALKKKPPVMGQEIYWSPDKGYANDGRVKRDSAGNRVDFTCDC